MFVKKSKSSNNRALSNILSTSAFTVKQQRTVTLQQNQSTQTSNVISVTAKATTTNIVNILNRNNKQTGKLPKVPIAILDDLSR